MPYEDYLKQLLSMEIAYNNILRRRRIWHLPIQCHTRILHLTAGLHSLVNRTISLKSTLLKRSCCTDSVLMIKHLLSRYSIVPQLAIICVIAGLLRPCLENRYHLFIYHKTLLPPFLIYYHTNSRTTRHTMQLQCHHHHRIQSTLHNPLSFKKRRNKYKKH